GNSGYEDAVESGEFEGTLKEWLNSLKGGLFQADFEDLEVTDDDVIKFKDRKYEDEEGLGYKILRKNKEIEGSYTTKSISILEKPEKNGNVRVTVGGSSVNVSLIGGAKRIVDFKVTEVPASAGNIIFSVPVEGDITVEGLDSSLNTPEKVVNYIVANIESEVYEITKNAPDVIRFIDKVKRPSIGYTVTSTAGVEMNITGVNNNGQYADTLEALLTKI